MDEIGDGVVRRCLQQLQESHCAKKRRDPVSVLELLTLTTEIAERPDESVPETMESDAAVAGVIMADMLQRAHQELDNANITLEKIKNV